MVRLRPAILGHNTQPAQGENHHLQGALIHTLKVQARAAIASWSNSHSSADLKEASQCLENVYSGNVITVEKDRATFDMHLHSCKFNSLELASLSFGTEVDLQQSPTGTLLISTQLQGWAQTRNHKGASAGGAGLVMFDGSHCSASKQFSEDSWRVHVRIPKDLLRSKHLEVYGHDHASPLDFNPALACGEAQIRWLGLLNVLLCNATSPSQAANHGTAHCISELVLMFALEEYYKSARFITTRHQSVLPKQVKIALAFIHEQRQRALTLGEIARAANTSVRALCDSFAKSHQTTPMRYLRELRLQDARELLRESPPGTLIADIAERCGFTHLGRFSAAYRNRFSELPSETLRR
ncbi:MULTISPECIES: AraC family transcriptional regulator [Pseudomonas]|uniref:Transcriptional regulator n=1 Tax=Pseudomonas monteilii TaxID=76759 RepID=A0AAE6RE14_9PSED|nr:MULTISPECIES: AraC family transcriptional regulator [Pseudomonas]MDH4846228.1 AraC family transcriptional regulator [Pseudomonas sp. BN605]MDH4858517.1 AraC family transcriptional regulator [Pseudomonas sp. BN505]NWL08003.1 hypothetical protein [Pseudomonas hunanensis]QHB28726.1 transcriptional regulator [Pseudomonas monteilii]